MSLVRSLLHRSRTGNTRAHRSRTGNCSIQKLTSDYTNSREDDKAAKCIALLRKFENQSRSVTKFATSYELQRTGLDALREIGNEMFEFAHKKEVLFNFVALGGPLVLVDLTVALSQHVKSGTIGFAGTKGPKYGVGITHLLNELCSVLREILYEFPSLCHADLVGSGQFVTHVMHYLLGINNSDTSCVLLEEMVAYRSKTFRLSDVPGFNQIVMTLSSRQLALFMRIFAILIFEPENKDKHKNPHQHGNANHGEDETKTSELSTDTVPGTEPHQTTTTPAKASALNGTSTSPLQTVENSGKSSSPPASSQTKSPTQLKATTSTGTAKDPLKKTMSLLCPPTWSRRVTNHTIDQNHAFLLNIPGLLKRMCRLLERIVCKALSTKMAERRNNTTSAAAAATAAAAAAARSRTPEERNMTQMATALRSIIQENPGDPNAALEELAYLFGIPVESLQHLARLNTGNMDLGAFMGTLLGDTSPGSGNVSGENNTIFSDDEADDDADNDDLDDPDDPLPPPVHFMSPDQHTALVNSIAGLPVLKKHQEGLDYDQMSILQHLVEVLFVIAILNGGRRKVDIQNCFAENGLPDTLSRLFDMLDWTPGQRQGHGPHGPGCQCNPKSAPKIQFLRLVHNFCDRDMMDVRHRAPMIRAEAHHHLQNIHTILSTHSYFAGVRLSTSSPMMIPAGVTSNGDKDNKTISDIMNEIHELHIVEYARRRELVQNLIHEFHS